MKCKNCVLYVRDDAEMLMRSSHNFSISPANNEQSAADNWWNYRQCTRTIKRFLRRGPKMYLAPSRFRRSLIQISNEQNLILTMSIHSQFHTERRPIPTEWKWCGKHIRNTKCKNYVHNKWNKWYTKVKIDCFSWRVAILFSSLSILELFKVADCLVTPTTPCQKWND